MEAAGPSRGESVAPPEDHESLPWILHAIAHQLSQPLTACRGTLELALLKCKSAAEYRKAAEKALAAAEKLATIVQMVRELAEAFEPPGKIVPVDLGVLTRQVVEDLAPIAESRGVMVVLDGALEIVINADEQRLYQAVLKTLHLAILRSPARGRVQVALFLPSAGEALLTIQDEGKHFSSLVHGRGREMPEPPAPDQREAQEYNWILMTARKIIETAGGSLAAENVAPRGCRICISLPRAPRNSA